MKYLNLLLIITVVLLSNYCITTTINQPPYVVEKNNPQWNIQNEPINEKNLKQQSQPYLYNNETEFFEELSKQDPNLEDCNNCNPDNRPPGFNENLSKPDKINTSNSEEVAIIIHPDSKENNANQNITDEITNEEGIASWYGKDFDGRPTASGEIFDSRKLTAAHRTLPLGSIVVVKNLDNNKEVILKINDRGPFIKNRIIDVSEYAAEVLDFKYKGITKVQIKVLKPGDLKEKNEGTTAFFFKRAEGEKGSSELPYEEMMNEKKEKILKNIKNVNEFKSYSVQVGNFTDIRNVIRLKEELEKKIPYPINIVKKENEFLVRIGTFSERYPAEVLKQKLAEEGYSGFVTSPSL